MTQLEKEAEEYENSFGEGANGTESIDFIAGANSKYVKKKIIEAQIEVLNKIKEHYQERVGTGMVWNKIQELQQQLKELEL